MCFTFVKDGKSKLKLKPKKTMWEHMGTSNPKYYYMDFYRKSLWIPDIEWQSFDLSEKVMGHRVTCLCTSEVIG